MDYVLVFVLGMLTATLLIRWLARRAIEKLVDALAKDIIEESEKEDKMIKLKVEEDNKIYFMYNADNGAFVCQGHDFVEIRKHFRERFPGYKAEVTGDQALLDKLRKDIETFNENSSNIGHSS